MMKTKRISLFLIVNLMALLLVACGGKSQSNPDQVTVRIKDEFTFDPSNITLTAGNEVQITFENTGTIDHSFAILKAGEEPEHLKDEVGDEEHVHESVLLEIHEIGPGEVDTETFTVPTEPGDYSFVCTVPGHIDAGLVGTLTVTE